MGDVECFWPECNPLEALTPTDSRGAMYRLLLQSLLQTSAVVGQRSHIIINTARNPFRFRFDTLKSIERPIEDPFEAPRHLERVRDQRAVPRQTGRR